MEKDYKSRPKEHRFHRLKKNTHYKSENEDKVAEDDIFARWVHCVRHLSRMHVLREVLVWQMFGRGESFPLTWRSYRPKAFCGEYYVPAMLRLLLQPRVRFHLLARSCPLALRRVGRIVLVKTSSAVVLNNVDGVWAVWPNEDLIFP